MAALDDLNQSVVDLKAAVSNAAAEMQKLADALRGFIASNDTAAIETVAQGIEAQAKALNDAVSSAETEITPPAAPPAT